MAKSVPRQFVSAAAAEPIPLNNVLKNNFWNGSHLFEWADAQKLLLQPFFDDPRRLQELSGGDCQIRAAPLGRLVGQARQSSRSTSRHGPLSPDFPQRFAEADFHVYTDWHPAAQKRPLRASCTLDFDGALDGYVSQPVGGPDTLLPMRGARGKHRGIVWDEQNHIVLADTAPSAFITYVPFNIMALDPEPRTFMIPGKDPPETIRIGLIGPYGQRLRWNARWRRQRRLDSQTHVQGAGPTAHEAARFRAIQAAGGTAGS